MERLTVMRLPRLLAGLAAFLGLCGLALVRLWAVLGGHVRGKAMLAAAALLAALAVFLFVRLRLTRLLPAFSWKTALTGAAAFALGAWLDTSYAMFSSTGLLIDAWPFRLACHAGSGLVLAFLVLSLLRAAEAFRGVGRGCGRTMLVLALVVNVTAALYFTGSATIHYWDATIYWNSSAMLAQQPLDQALLRLVLESVITQEYNYLLAFPISLVMRLLGTGRYVYLFSIVNLYVLPALWGMCVLARRRKGGGVLLFLLTPMLLYTGLVGFSDVAAAGAGIWACALYTDEERPAAARGILAGALLALTFLLRRYFFFFAVSFGGAALLALVPRRRDGRAFLALFASAAGCGVFFAQSFLVEKVLGANYGDVYSAYDQGRRVDVMMLARYFGVVLMAAALVGVIFLLLRRREARCGALLALCQPVLSLLLFTRVQSHGQQHLLLYLPALCWVFARVLAELPPARPAAVCAWGLAVVTTASSLLPRVQPSSPQEIQTPSPLPSFTYMPPRRGDIAQLVSLRTYVDGLSAQAPKTAAIVSSSFTFNSSIYDTTLRSMNIPEPKGPETQIIYMASVDKRDGFSWNILTADYLVVGDPVQTHLGEENQQIVALVAHAVLDGTGLGTAYRPLDTEFHLDGGVRVRIYERTRAITAEEYRDISAQLTARYPDYSALYQAPAWTAEGRE